MKRFAALALLLLTAVPLWADTPIAEITDFSAGVDTQHLPEKIKGLQNAANFQTDQNFGLKRRKGWTNETVGCSSSPAASQVWSFTDTTGSEWFIRLDTSGWMTAANGLGRATTCLTTNVTGQLSTSVDTDADVGLGLFWFTNKTNGLWSWDRTTVTQYPNAPLAGRVAVYRNRVILSDISNEQSSIRMSGELNGGDWSNDSRFSTSPVSIRIGGVNDGYKVYDFFPGMGEGIIFKGNSMWRLLGNDQRDFRVEQITPEIGTIYPNTISQRGFNTMFLSNRGIDSYTPPFTFTPIGNPIQNLVDPLARQSSLSNARSIDSASDWSTGVSSPSGAGNVNISTYVIAGRITPNNYQYITTTDAEWQAGVMSPRANADLKAINGDLVFTSTVTPGNSNFSFETASVCCSTSPLNWGVIGTIAQGRNSTFNHDGGVMKDGSWGIYANDSGTDREGVVVTGAAVIISIYNHATGALLQRQSYPLTVRAITHPAAWPEVTHWENKTLDTTANAGTLGRVEIGVSITGTGTNLQSPRASTATATFGITLTTSVSVWATAEDFERAVPNIEGMTVAADLVYADDAFVPSEQPPDITYTAWYQSPVFDTRVSSPSWDPFKGDVSGGTVTWATRTSSAAGNCCWMAREIASTGSVTTLPVILSSANRYIQYIASFSAVNSQVQATTQIRIASTTLGSYATGYFRYGPIDLGSGVSSFGLFTAVDGNGGDGSVSYETQSNASPVFVESAWSPTALNTIPSMAANRYVWVKTTFQTKAATTAPYTDSFTINWNIGAGNPKPFGKTFRESYYLYFSTNLSNITTNDVIAAYNRDDKMNTFYGSTLAAATVYNNTLMMADSLATGAVWSLDKSPDGTDQGRNVASYFTARRLDAGSPDAEKVFDSVRLTVSREDVGVSQIFKVEYAIDASTSFLRASNIEISTGTAIASLTSDIPQDQLRQGHYIDIKVTELTQGTMPYTINRMALYGEVKPIP